jgi:hypothetical protein
MGTYVELPTANQTRIARKPIGRKAVAASTSLSDHIDPVELYGSNPTSTLSQPSDFPCELPGSAVPSQLEPNHTGSLRAGAAIHSLPQSTLIVPVPSNNAATLATDTNTVNHGRAKTNEPVVQNGSLEKSARSDAQCVGPDDGGSSPTTTHTNANQMRRMRRRTMMMGLTANFGTTQSQIEPPSLGGALPQPGYSHLSEAPPASSGSLSQAGSALRIDSSLQTRSPANMRSPMPVQASSPPMPPVQPGCSAQPSNSPSSFAWPSPRLQESAWSPPVQNPASSLTTSQSSVLPSNSIPQTMPSTMPVQSMMPAQSTMPVQFSMPVQSTMPVQYSMPVHNNRAPQQHHILTGHQMSSLPAASMNTQIQTSVSPSLAPASAQNGRFAQRSTSIQSGQTISSVTSLCSDPRSTSSVGSPITNVTTPSTVYSPLSQVSGPPRMPLASGPDSSVSFFSICSSCKTGEVTTIENTAANLLLIFSRSYSRHLILRMSCLCLWQHQGQFLHLLLHNRSRSGRARPRTIILCLCI